MEKTRLDTRICKYKNELLELANLTEANVNSLFPDPYNHYGNKFKQTKFSFFTTCDSVIFYMGLDFDNKYKLSDGYGICGMEDIGEFFQWMKCSLSVYALGEIIYGKNYSEEDLNQIEIQWRNNNITHFFFNLPDTKQELLIDSYFKK